ncbi:MAG: hypothetical protein IPO00_06860 [Betaproteobacteria bacterium]|nr:hypothetical protein [Betaproteobacteria bacterium]
MIYQELLPELDRMTALYQAEPVDRDGVESLVKELEDRYAEAFERHTKEFEATASDREKEKTARVKRVFKGIFVVLGCVLGFPALISLIQNLPSAPYVPPKLTEQELRVQTAQFEQIERNAKLRKLKR